MCGNAGAKEADVADGKVICGHAIYSQRVSSTTQICGGVEAAMVPGASCTRDTLCRRGAPPASQLSRNDDHRGPGSSPSTLVAFAGGWRGDTIHGVYKRRSECDLRPNQRILPSLREETGLHQPRSGGSARCIGSGSLGSAGSRGNAPPQQPLCVLRPLQPLEARPIHQECAPRSRSQSRADER